MTTTVTVTPSSTEPGVVGLGTSTRAVAHRTVLKFVRTPQLIVLSTIQASLFLLIFRYVFGGAVHASGLRYVDFLVPGFVTAGLLFSGAAAASGVAEDIEHGFFDRLRSLPIPRTSVLAGRSLADTAMLTWGLVVSIAIGFAVGFRLHNGITSALVAAGLCILFGFAFEWLFMTMGLVAGNAQAAQSMSVLVFPLTFVSSAFVPVATMPGWMQPVAENQPITVMVNAVRGLTQGAGAEQLLPHTTAYYVGVSLLWTVGITLVFGTLAVTRFTRR